MNNFWNKDGLVADVIKTSTGIKYITEDDVKSSSVHAVGEQWISFDGTIPEGGLPFDGQLRNVELYQQLFNWAKENGRVIDEEDWQLIRETNNDNVPYYSAGDGTNGQKRVIEVNLDTITDGASIDFILGETRVEGTVEEIVTLINNGTLGDGRFTAELVSPNVSTYPYQEYRVTIIITAKECSEIDNTYDVYSIYHIGIRDLAEGISPRESTTFRLPIFNSYFKADVAGGGYIAEGLPNITGTVGAIAGAKSSGVNTGAFAHGGDAPVNITNGGENDYKADFDASRCSAIYGNSEHVTPETSTVIVGVWAVGSYTNVTNIDVSEIKSAINAASTYDSMPLLMSHWDNKGFVSAGWVRADGYWLDGNLYKDAYEKLLEISSNSVSPTGIDYGMKVKYATYSSSLDKSNPYDFLIDKTAAAFRLPFLSKADRLIVNKTSSQMINGGSTPRAVTETWYSDGTIEIDGTYDASSSTSGTINWITSLQVPYNLILQDTRQEGTETDTGGWEYVTGPSGYTATSFRVSHYKGTGKLIDFHIKGEPTIVDVPKYRMMYFKLGNTFINEDQMDANYLATKIDTIYNSWQEADYVVESYSNGTEWYRLYKSGWIEQGGKHTSGSSVTVTLHLPFIDTNYNLQLATYASDNAYAPCIMNKATTSFTIRSGGNATKTGDWYACGF